MTNETENRGSTAEFAAADEIEGVKSKFPPVDAAQDPTLSGADAADQPAPADNPDTSRAGAREVLVGSEIDRTLIDHTAGASQGQTIEADGNALKLGAEIPMRGIGLPDLDQSNVAPSPPDPRLIARDALSELAAVEAHIDTLEERKKVLRQQLGAALANFKPDDDGAQKLVTPFGTASLNDAPRRVKITNESVVPTDFKKFVIDEKKVGDALRAGNVVAGAELSNGGDKIVRVTWPKKGS